MDWQAHAASELARAASIHAIIWQELRKSAGLGSMELAYRHTSISFVSDSLLSAVGSPKTPSAAQTTHLSQLSTVGSPNAIDAAMHHA